jgi:hypothetical protein
LDIEGMNVRLKIRDVLLAEACGTTTNCRMSIDTEMPGVLTRLAASAFHGKDEIDETARARSDRVSESFSLRSR